MDSRVIAGSRALRRRGAAIEVALLALFALLLHAAPARADNVDTLIGQLDDKSEKIRLSAVLNLIKLGDARAIPPLLKVLKDDSSKNVRSITAGGLGSLVTPDVKGKVRSDAIAALQSSSADDPSPVVQAQAQRSLNTIGASGPPPQPTGKGGGVYVNIGPMSSKTGTPNDTKLRAMMTKVATKTLGKVASNMPTTWAGGGVPTAAALSQKNVMGFFLDGTLNELKVSTSGGSATISCKVNMLLADFPNKSIFGFLNGGAKVQGSSSPKDVELATEDCVTAVVENLVATKIVPTITSKSGVAPTPSKGGTP
jgi:HEAT repeats